MDLQSMIDPAICTSFTSLLASRGATVAAGQSAGMAGCSKVGRLTDSDIAHV